MLTVKLSPTLRRLLLHCQTECTADCCRDRAFDISARTITSWLETERIDRTPQLIREIKDIAGNLDPMVEMLFLEARDLHSEWRSADFATFWARFEKSFANSLKTYTNPRA